MWRLPQWSVSAVGRDVGIERVGFFCLALLAGIAGMGAFGGGPAGLTRVGGPGLRVSYEEIGRVNRKSRLVIRSPRRPGETSIRLWISRDIVDQGQLQPTSPGLRGIVIYPDRYIFEFGEITGTFSAPASFDFTPRTAGTIAGGIGVEGGAAAEVRYFIYP